MASCQWSPPHTSAPDLNLPPVKGRVKKLPLFSSNLLLSLPLRALVVMCEIHSYNQSLLLNLFLKSEIGFGFLFPLDCHSLVGSSWCTKILHIFCTRSLKQITSLGALQCNALHSDGQTSVWQLSYNQPQPNYRHSDSSDPDNQLLTPQPTHFLIRTQILISIKSFQITLSSEITLLVSFKPLLPVFFLGCRQRWCRCSANKVCPVCLQLMSSVEWKLRDPGWLLWQVWCDMCYAIWSLIAWNRQRCPCCLASSRQEHYGIKSPWRSSPVNCQAANHGLSLRNSKSFFIG